MCFTVQPLAFSKALLGTKFYFMKRTLLAAFILASAAFSAKAQQGSVLLYGNVGLNTSSNKNNGDGSAAKSTSFNFSPGIGYQFNKNITAGVELGVAASKGHTPSFQAGPFARYTWPINGVFAIYSQLGIGYLHQGQTNLAATASDNLPANSNAFYAKLSGPTVFINVKNNFGVNLGFGSLDFVSGKPKDGKNVSAFGINFGNAMSVGISKNFGGKK